MWLILKMDVRSEGEVQEEYEEDEKCKKQWEAAKEQRKGQSEERKKDEW